MIKKKNIIITFIFMFILIFFMSSYLIKEDSAISYSERRKLSSFPKISKDKVFNGDFFEDFEDYLMDQSIFRDDLRHFKSVSIYDVLRIKDKNNIYINEGKLYEMKYPLNEASIYNAAAVFNDINDDMLGDLNVYYSIIPDKSYFVAKENGYLSMDYTKLLQIMNDSVHNMKYIDIFDKLVIDDYYDTDLHWRQDKIIDVADYILRSMGNEKNIAEYDEHIVDNFRGSYYGQAAMFENTDNIKYLTNDVIDNAVVFDVEKNKNTIIYNKEDLDNPDMYDIYLGGPKALLEIENKHNKSGKELYVFRDSFGSSITPLLLKDYSKITLIDLRYITRDTVKELVDFKKGSDVLFLYSTLILDKSSTISR